MTLDELEKRLEVGSRHSVVVHLQELQEPPGYVRTITISRGARVTLEYLQWQCYVRQNGEDGILKYIGEYASLEAAVGDLEDFIGTRVAEWRDCDQSSLEPSVANDPDPAAALACFEDLVRRGAIPLPTSTVFRPAHGYWRHIMKYGSYRPEMELEEQEEHFASLDRTDES